MQIEVTQADIDTVRKLGGTGTDIFEYAIHRKLDEAGIPREGRTVKVTRETTDIVLPPGYDLEDLEDESTQT
jgi:hypothetical protein